MERNLTLTSIAAFVLLVYAGTSVFCRSSQAHETGQNFQAEGGSQVRKSSLEIVLPPATVLPSASREEDKTASNTRQVFQSQGRIHNGGARDLSPPLVWPTSDDPYRAEFILGSDSEATNHGSPATSLEENVRLGTSAVHLRPTTKLKNTTERCLFLRFARGIFREMVSSLTALFKGPSGNHGVQGPYSSDNSPLADPNANTLHILFGSYGELSRHGKSLSRDVSLTEMWPMTSTHHQADAFGKSLSDLAKPTSDSRKYKHGRPLPSDASAPGMWAKTCNGGECDVTPSRALVDDAPSSSVKAGIVSKHVQYKHRRALLRDISPPGMWPITSDDDEFEVYRRRALLSDDSSDSSSAIGTTASEQRQKHGRALLRDISPPGMWPITSDDDEFEVGRRRALLSDDSPDSPSATASTSNRHRYQKQRRALLRDISPPGMWPSTSDDDEFVVDRRRALLSNDSPHSSSAATATIRDRQLYHKQRRALLRDISPPGMWPITADDDELHVARRRALLSEDSLHSSSAIASTSDRHGYQKQRRALLRDISPPGMWPITSDDDEFEVSRRRALLSDSSPRSSSATASTTDRHRYQKQRRALLRDISPPGMWPITSDDGEFAVAGRRKLLSGDSLNSPSEVAATGAPHEKQGRGLRRDTSSPGMWPAADDQEVFYRLGVSKVKRSRYRGDLSPSSTKENPFLR